MKIFAIGDLHLDGMQHKPMDIFGKNWIDHESKIFQNWCEVVSQGDIVLIPGDISWAMHLKEACVDLSKIEKLPGIKIMIRGNHDYWWTSKSKMNALGLSTIKFICNDNYKDEDFAVCGVRGWFNVRDINSEDKDSQNENMNMSADDLEKNAHNRHVYERELARLQNSVDGIKKFKGLKIAMLHYPPFKADGGVNDFGDILSASGIDMCLYGHLHGEEGHKLVREGKYDGVEYICVSSDYIDFKLKEIRD